MPLLISLEDARAVVLHGHHLSQGDVDSANTALVHGVPWDEVIARLRAQAETIEENYAAEWSGSSANLIYQMTRYNRSGS